MFKTGLDDINMETMTGTVGSCNRQFGGIQKFFDTIERVEVPQEWATVL